MRDAPLAAAGIPGTPADPGAGRRVPYLGLTAATVLALLMFLYRYLDDLAMGHPVPVLVPLLTETTGVYGAALLLPLLVRFVRGRPLTRATWLRHLPAYAAAAALFGVVHTTWMWGSREVLFRLAGLGDYDYGAPGVRYAMEFPVQLIVFVSTVTFVHLLDRYRAARRQELRMARLEARLAHARLQNLQAQLNPHFLFNTLNAISSVMYEDVVQADRMISGLSDLLRHALQSSTRQEVTLAEELEVLDLYLDAMRARFGERLRVRVEVAEEVRAALVPTLLLQPLVENAIRHGAPPPPAPAEIRVRGRREGGALVLEVADNGPGLGGVAPAPGAGVGLANTAERLRGLYGDEQSLALEDGEGGGLRVTVRIPFHQVPVPAAGAEAAWTGSAS
jgi:two-component system, LytTR family, sensor kinase